RPIAKEESGGEHQEYLRCSSRCGSRKKMERPMSIRTLLHNGGHRRRASIEFMNAGELTARSPSVSSAGDSHNMAKAMFTSRASHPRRARKLAASVEGLEAMVMLSGLATRMPALVPVSARPHVEVATRAASPQVVAATPTAMAGTGRVSVADVSVQV